MVIAAGFGDFLSRALAPKSASRVKKTYAKTQNKFTNDPLQAKISLGERIVLYVRNTQGDEFADNLLIGYDPQMPHKFWAHFIRNELELEYNTRQRLRCYRAMEHYLGCWRQGKRTMQAMLDGVRPKSKRKKGTMGNLT